MEIRFSEQERVLMIALFGELDHHNSITARERIDLKLSTGSYKKIIYSLSGLSFMDSSGIGLIANGCKTAAAIGAVVLVYTQNEKYLKMFQLAKLNELCRMIETEKELNTLWK
ncbi:MAG: anti-sigma factor antagonist [Clostridia bacterium]|nr:anti-sigma factor antagonist [Clostridia bacterium]